jgi:archaeal preflagellin peptidase FlaK
MNQILDTARVVLCLGFLIYASWSDYKTREVSNKVWIIFGPVALALTGLQFLVFSSQPFELIIMYLLSFAITSGLAIAVFYVGGFGGADAKAFMCIALGLPIYPNSLLAPAGFVSPLFPITIFTNSVLLGALSVFYTLFRNILWSVRKKDSLFHGLKNESFGHKLLAVISGYKVEISELEKGHMYPLEDIASVDYEPKRKLLTFPKYEEREDIIRRLKENFKDNYEVWVTPGLPLLIFIAVGLLIALIYGDIVWTVLQLVL